MGYEEIERAPCEGRRRTYRVLRGRSRMLTAATRTPVALGMEGPTPDEDSFYECTNLCRSGVLFLCTRVLLVFLEQTQRREPQRCENRD